ncbi:MAG TPA: endo-1,4-beta-xylanase [Candidatus Sulfotelmatobacter sp.]
MRIAFTYCQLAAFYLFAIVPAATPTLRLSADHTGILIGTAVRSSLLHEAAYAATLSREFNMVEAEDAMKWWTVRQYPDKFDFTQGDELVRFAQAHWMKIRGHCLVWDHNNPDWLAHGNFTSAQLSRLLQDHIATVVKHYAGQVFAWDVVNEGFDEHGIVRNSIWYNQPGIGFANKDTAYIEQAFRWTHEADPHALLFYNEAEAEGLNPKSDAIYAMLKDFKHRGVPIDGVGLQMHITSLEPDLQSIAANMSRIAGLGLQIQITELDVPLAINTGAVSVSALARPEDLDRQAQVYRGVVRICLDNPGCTAIQTWGFTDKYSWIGSHSHGSQGWALPFDRTYRPKPAYNAIVEELDRGRNLH